MNNNKFICYNSPWGRICGMDWLGWPAAWYVYDDPLVASVPLPDWQDSCTARRPNWARKHGWLDSLPCRLVRISFALWNIQNCRAEDYPVLSTTCPPTGALDPHEQSPRSAGARDGIVGSREGSAPIST